MNIYWKALLFLFCVSFFHFGYDITGWESLKPFFGTSESIFQHLKMAFWGYLLLSAFEYFLLKREIYQKIKNFWYSRIFSAIIVPWIVVLVWYLLPAIYGRVESLTIELFWALLATYLSGVLTIQIEKETEKTPFSTNTKAILLILLVVSAFMFIIFTYKLPWVDLFANPEAL